MLKAKSDRSIDIEQAKAVQVNGLFNEN